MTVRPQAPIRWPSSKPAQPFTIDGKNETERKANLVLILADDPAYQQERTRQREARQRLGDAERRITVSKERCRLLRAAVALQAPVED